jgi:hypothetical protein
MARGEIRDNRGGGGGITIAYNAPCGSMTFNPIAFPKISTTNFAFPLNTSTTPSKNSGGVFKIVGNAV